MTKLATVLPTDKNGLGLINDQLVEQPETQHVVVAVIDTAKVTLNVDDETSEPTIRIRAIEPLTGERATQAQQLLDDAFAARTGRQTLTFDRDTGEIGSRFD